MITFSSSDRGQCLARSPGSPFLFRRSTIGLTHSPLLLLPLNGFVDLNLFRNSAAFGLSSCHNVLTITVFTTSNQADRWFPGLRKMSSLDRQQRLTREQWECEINTMMGWGARVRPEDRETLLEYLS